MEFLFIAAQDIGSIELLQNPGCYEAANMSVSWAWLTYGLGRGPQCY